MATKRGGQPLFIGPIKTQPFQLPTGSLLGDSSIATGKKSKISDSDNLDGLYFQEYAWRQNEQNLDLEERSLKNKMHSALTTKYNGDFESFQKEEKRV